MNRLLPRPPEVAIDFTDAQPGGFGGWPVPGQMADRPGLPRALSSVSVRRRARGARAAGTLWSLIASPAAGNGALSDLDALRAGRVGQRLSGPGHVPSGRRPGAYLARMDEGQVEALPAVAGHEEAVRGDVPVFIGSLWARGRLHPGGVDVARGWREQPDRDVAVWRRADNACCRERGRDCPVSLTDRRKRAPVPDVIPGFPGGVCPKRGGPTSGRARM